MSTQYQTRIVNAFGQSTDLGFQTKRQVLDKLCEVEFWDTLILEQEKQASAKSDVQDPHMQIELENGMLKVVPTSGNRFVFESDWNNRVTIAEVESRLDVDTMRNN